MRPVDRSDIETALRVPQERRFIGLATPKIVNIIYLFNCRSNNKNTDKIKDIQQFDI